MLCRIGHDDAPRMDIVLELLKSAQAMGIFLAEKFIQPERRTLSEKENESRQLAADLLPIVFNKVVVPEMWIFARKKIDSIGKHSREVVT
uniref:Uncharacterized protein n=1 Tax=Parascaris univalens TaxID=6257 RepID=A0A915A4H5_PARUN